MFHVVWFKQLFSSTDDDDLSPSNGYFTDNTSPICQVHNKQHEPLYAYKVNCAIVSVKSKVTG